MRNRKQLYPDYSAEIEAIEQDGISESLLYKIIKKHMDNIEYNKSLFERYEVLDVEDGGVPIFRRKARFEEDSNIINNKINNDFFGEIIDFKTGYFAGRPISYTYCDTEESKDVTGGEEAVDEANKVLSDFVVRNNMFDKDMEMTKNAAICGYSGRLFYHDLEGNERVLILPGFETIILSKTDITEPLYGIRLYQTTDINNNTIWKVEFYDSNIIKYYKGNLSNLQWVKDEQNLYDYCPLQGIPNNNELLGDAEKVLAEIDDYDRVISDNSNDIESFSSAYMVFENIITNENEMEKAQKTGAIQFRTGPTGGRVYYLTKDINDTFTENHLNRIEDNIYRFSKTPNLDDDSFGTASGISLKFKLTGLETKCGMFQAKVMSAGVYMFKLLASSWTKKKISFDPLQCTMEFKRNFPVDILGEAQAAQALINTGMPKEIAWNKSLSFIGDDDINYISQLIEEEQNNILPLSFDTSNEEENDNESFDSGE